MTEAYAPLELQVRWYGSADGKEKGAHMPFNFALITDLNEKSNATDFQKACQKWDSAKPAYGINNWVLGNHVSEIRDKNIMKLMIIKQFILGPKSIWISIWGRTT